MNRDALELRHERVACEPQLLCEALGLLGQPGSFRRQAKGVLVRCCAHEERTPSMSVTRAPDGTLRVRCFACGFKTDAIGLVRRVHGASFREALALLARMAGRWDLLAERERCNRTQALTLPKRRAEPWGAGRVDSDLRDHVYRSLLDLCPLRPDSPVGRYLDRRALFADAEAAGLGALPVRRDQQHAVMGRLASALDRATVLLDLGLAMSRGSHALRAPHHCLLIPWRGRDGRISALQRRRLDPAEPRYVFPPGLSPAAPFGADVLRGGEAEGIPMVVTEGALDCLARRKLARLVGQRVAVLAVPSATTVRAEWSTLFDGRDVLVAFDPDKSGDEGARRFADACLRGARSVQRERPRGGDWNEVLIQALTCGACHP
jgi:DNA primase